MSPSPLTLDIVLRRAVSALSNAGVEGPSTDARILAAAAFGLSREDMLREPDMHLSTDAMTRFLSYLQRRSGREPISRILGRREFRGLDFQIDPATLDPRPDSESVVDAVLETAAKMQTNIRLLDVGTGSGCLLLSVLRALPEAWGVGTDIEANAVACARRNAAALKLTDRVAFVSASWGRGIQGPFDIVLSNPPYISTADIGGLAPEVSAFDPITALDGGEDGLEAFRAISSIVGAILTPSGKLVLEIGAGQAAEVQEIFSSVGYTLASTRNDLAGHMRVLVFSRGLLRNG